MTLYFECIKSKCIWFKMHIWSVYLDKIGYNLNVQVDTRAYVDEPYQVSSADLYSNVPLVKSR